MKPLLAILLTAMLFSCKQDDKTPLPAIESYRVEGAKDITYSYKESVLPLTVKEVAGVQESVTLNIEGLPAGVKAAFSSNTQVPTYDTKLSFSKTGTVAWGVYPLRLIASSALGVQKEYGFKLTIQNDCALALPGEYNETISPATTQGVSAKVAAETPDRVDFFTSGGTRTLYAVLDCDKHTATVPSQPYNGSALTTVSGSGIFTIGAKNKLYFNLVLSDGTSMMMAVEQK